MTKNRYIKYLERLLTSRAAKRNSILRVAINDEIRLIRNMTTWEFIKYRCSLWYTCI